MYVVLFSNALQLNLILNSIVSSAIMADLGDGATYPLIGSNSAFSYAILASKDPRGESTQMGAFWWDGGQSIYKYAFDIHILTVNLLCFRDN